MISGFWALLSICTDILRLIVHRHDKARLIVLALAIVCLPVLAYGLHRVVRFIFSDSVSDQPEVKS